MHSTLLVLALAASDPVSRAVEESCTTSVLNDLSNQLIEEIQCLRPGTLASLDGEAGFELGAAAFPWLQTPARDALVRAQKARGTTMTINSGLRTLPQQYVLYRWSQAKRCGIGLAATPGKSNHESGLAIDVEDNAGWRAPLEAEGFTWLGASDPVHYDFTGAGRVELGGLSVRAFQQLWNRNHPSDVIDEDGIYGPDTETRIGQAPIGGFPKGADCNEPPPPPEMEPPATAPPAEDEGCSTTGRPLDASGVLLLALLLVRRRLSGSAAR